MQKHIHVRILEKGEEIQVVDCFGLLFALDISLKKMRQTSKQENRQINIRLYIVLLWIFAI